MATLPNNNLLVTSATLAKIYQRYSTMTSKVSAFPLLVLLFLLTTLMSCNSEEKGNLQIGDQAPDFAAKDLNQNKVRLSDWKGSPVILRFWSTDCKYCRADTPIFNRYFDKYREKGLHVVYINTEQDPQENVAQFVRDLEIGFPVILDEGGNEIASKYRVKVVPQTIIINPQGIITAAILGGVGEAELEELVGKYF